MGLCIPFFSQGAPIAAGGRDARIAAYAQREGCLVIDDKTRDIIAAILTIPVANKRLETIRVDKYEGQGMKDIVDYFFALKKTLKREYDEGR
jgi:hypothetical protein